jgi:hypothetical protein
MAQIQVNLEAVPVVIGNRRLPLESLKLDAQKKRIGLYQDSQPKAALSDEEFRHTIINGSPVAYSKRRDSIEINGCPDQLH